MFATDQSWRSTDAAYCRTTGELHDWSARYRRSEDREPDYVCRDCYAEWFNCGTFTVEEE